MQQALTMQANDSQNNIKAAAVTIAVHAVLLLMFFFITIAMAVPTPPPLEEGIEVNLGNSDIGFGDVQPLVPDAPAPESMPETSPPKQQIAEPVNEPEKEVSERDEADAPEVKKPEKVTKPTKITPTNTPPVVNNKPVSNTVVTPTPAPKKPKAVYSGGTGTGGNNSDTYNNSRNQGIAGGTGDQGKANGNPNSDNYNGNGGNGKSGASVIKGTRTIVTRYVFIGDLEKATINAVIDVSPDGKGTFLSFAQGSTYTSQAYRSAIMEYLRNIKFSTASESSKVTVRFEFRVKE